MPWKMQFCLYKMEQKANGKKGNYKSGTFIQALKKLTLFSK